VFLTLATDLAGVAPASDFGFLLHKNPARPQGIEITGGTAQVFYPEATDDRCTAAVLLEIDPIALVRSGRGKAAEGFTLGQYVNDRPYAASSLLAVALGKLFRTAMNGRCDARPELAARPIPLEIHVPALPCWRRACSRRWAGLLTRGRCRSTRRSLRGVIPGTSTCG
jgi:hypothetical protein